MTRRAFFLLVLLIALVIPMWIAPGWLPPRPLPADAKLIALSFDDVPRGPGGYYTPAEREARLIAGLRRAGVEQAAFFVNPGRIGPVNGGEARVRAYVAAGHVIADHSFSHRNLASMPADAFLADVDQAEQWLRGRPGYRPWFRFPGLNQGGHDDAKRHIVLAGLKQRGLLVGSVTVDASDWNLDRLASDALKAGRPVDDAALRAFYVETMVQAADFSDGVMRRAIGRSPVHMLLLHETDLAARYIEPLVAALRADGWRIVSADAAYADPIYHQLPDIASNGTLTEALGFSRGIKGPLSYDRTDVKVGARLFAERVLHQGVPAPPPAPPPADVAAAAPGGKIS